MADIGKGRICLAYSAWKVILMWLRNVGLGSVGFVKMLAIAAALPAVTSIADIILGVTRAYAELLSPARDEGGSNNAPIAKDDLTLTESRASLTPSQNTNSQPLEFEAASIREVTGSHVMEGEGSGYSGDTLTLRAHHRADLIAEAYGLRKYQVSMPRNEELYDVAAKAGTDRIPTKSEFRQMLQSLLADRFKLKLHRELRETPVYVLAVARDGPKIKRSNPDVHQPFQVTMDTFAQRIMDLYGVDRPVVNETGLTGEYDIEMNARSEYLMERFPRPGDVSIFTAVQEQLGLKLEAQKRPIEIFVVDHMEKPSEN